MKKEKRILYNAMRTPDGTILVSQHRHDYVTHTDKNGSFYMLDGGLDYYRYSSPGDHVFIQLTDEDPFEDIRLVFTRGSRGKNGDQPLKWIPLCEMTDEHLKATYQYCLERGQTEYLDLYLLEMDYRELHKIEIKD